MNVQNYVDQVVAYLQTPIGWVVLALILLFGFFLLKGNPPGR